jgi:hypothetical protein
MTPPTRPCLPPKPLNIPPILFEKDSLLNMSSLLKGTGVAFDWGTHLPLVPQSFRHPVSRLQRIDPFTGQPHHFDYPLDLPVRVMTRERPLPFSVPVPPQQDHLHQHVFIRVEADKFQTGGGLSLASAVAFGAYRPVLVVSIDDDHSDKLWVGAILSAFNVVPFPSYPTDESGHVHYPDPRLLQPGFKLTPNKVVLDYTGAFKTQDHNKKCVLRKVEFCMQCWHNTVFHLLQYM